MRVFAVDPGGTSGWACWRDGEVTSGQLEFDPFVDMFEQGLQHGWCINVIVAERFTISARTVKLSQQTTALEVIGYLRAMAHLEGIPFVLQTPADAKRFTQVDNDAHARLDMLGWTQRPLAKHDHANDALRHLLLYLVKNRLIEPPR